MPRENERLRLRQAVVVEGKYDKLHLEPLLDTLIVTLEGFGIYHDREKREFLRALAEKRGLVILTDSDAAGFRLRSFLCSFLPGEALVQVYIPDIPGKERRKARAGREGKLGVEGVDLEILREAFRRAGLTEDEAPFERETCSKLDLYEWGLLGGEGSAEKRRRLLKALGLPQRLSTNMMPQALSALVSREELLQALRAL